MTRDAKWTLLAGAVVLAIAIGERARPLRARTRPPLARAARNVAMGAACAAVVQAVEVPLTRRVARTNAARARGLAHRMPRRLRAIAGVLAMDYGFYLWHVATHRLRPLWRLHRVHHVDPDLTASTAVRFHALDMLVSLPWRLAQVRLSGVDERGLGLWRAFFHLSILFHHANLRIAERKLDWLLTTPAMHGIHHARDARLRDTNFSSGFSAWDRLHGTFRRGAQPQIGVGDARATADVALLPAFAAPFRPLPAPADRADVRGAGGWAAGRCGAGRGQPKERFDGGE